MQFNLKIVFAMITYSAICLVLYLNPSLWVGTLIVVATASLYAIAAVEAYRRQRSFYLGFSIVGLFWMVFWFGFYFETFVHPGNPYVAWNLPMQMAKFVSLGESYEPDPNAQDQMQIVSYTHSVHFSSAKSVNPTSRPIPSYQNATRFAVCLTSIPAAIVGGFIFGLTATKRTRNGTSAGIAAEQTDEPEHSKQSVLNP